MDLFCRQDLFAYGRVVCELRPRSQNCRSTNRYSCWQTVCLFLLLIGYPLANGMQAGEPRRLTHDGKLKFAPTFTANGKEIVYSIHEEPTRVSLKKLELSAGSETLLYPSLAAHQHDPDFSPDGRLLCFAMSSGSPQLVLIIKDLQTKGESSFHPQGARSTVRTPRFTPDNKRIVFMLSAPGGQQIATVDVEGGNLSRLTQSEGMNCWPSVSPDGQQIVFGSSRDGGFCIYAMNIDGSSVLRLTRHPLRDMRPVWSPDGGSIAFASNRDGNSEVYIMDRDGRRLRRVTHHPERDDYPVWHPDGRQILMVSQRGGAHDLYLVDVPAAD
jgi:TolB protein